MLQQLWMAQDRGSFNGRRACLQDEIAVLRAVRGHDRVRRSPADQRARDHRARDRIGDLGVTANQRHALVIAGVLQLGQQRLQRVCARAGRRQDRRQQPAGLCADGEYVIRIDGQRQSTCVDVDERDRIGRGDQRLVTPAHDRRVTAHARTLEHGSISTRP